MKWTLTRDEQFNFRASHWADLHGLLYNALPPNIFKWGHHFLSFSISSDCKSVQVKAKVLHTNDTTEIVGDLLVAADGCLSSIRQSFLPHLKLRYVICTKKERKNKGYCFLLSKICRRCIFNGISICTHIYLPTPTFRRYSGYCAWRGVLDFTGNENSETMMGIRKAYPELGNCLYFDLGPGTHCGLYELLNKRLNWIWYVNQPEPQLKVIFFFFFFYPLSHHPL